VRTTLIVAALSAILLSGVAVADAPRTESYSPSYVPPGELVTLMGAREADGRAFVVWTRDGAEHRVELRRHDAANLLMMTGGAEDLEAVRAQLRTFDVAPSQISIEARVVEVDTDRAKDLGIDWSQVNLSARLEQQISRQATDNFRRYANGDGDRGYDRSTRDSRTELSSLTLSNALRLLQEEGAATYRDAPHVLTLNNQPATVFDGTRVTYVTRASSFANIYETEAMDAGLKLEVTPSRLESGYLRLRLHAELTSLLNLTSTSIANVNGSPIKEGQQVDDIVMAKDGETLLLGGFTRTVKLRVHRSFPGLGQVLPFLFSRDVEEERHHAILIAITPRVVPLGSGVDDRTRRMLGEQP
jgi:type III secretion protein C